MLVHMSAVQTLAYRSVVNLPESLADEFSLSILSAKIVDDNGIHVDGNGCTIVCDNVKPRSDSTIFISQIPLNFVLHNR